jgi:hypothetical protein
MRHSRETAESVEVRRSPQRSSDVFQRCSNRPSEMRQSRKLLEVTGLSRVRIAPPFALRAASGAHTLPDAATNGLLNRRSRSARVHWRPARCRDPCAGRAKVKIDLTTGVCLGKSDRRCRDRRLVCATVSSLQLTRLQPSHDLRKRWRVVLARAHPDLRKAWQEDQRR